MLATLQSDAAQDVVALCCKVTLLIHVQLVVHRVSWGPFLKGCLWIAGCSLYRGTSLFYAGCIVLTSGETHEVPVSSFLQPVQLASTLSSVITTSCNLMSPPD